jgi:flavoprotein
LKTKLTSEVAKYRISNINVEKYYDLHEQLKQISHANYRNISLEEEYINNIKK